MLIKSIRPTTTKTDSYNNKQVCRATFVLVCKHFRKSDFVGAHKLRSNLCVGVSWMRPDVLYLKGTVLHLENAQICSLSEGRWEDGSLFTEHPKLSNLHKSCLFHMNTNRVVKNNSLLFQMNFFFFLKPKTVVFTFLLVFRLNMWVWEKVQTKSNCSFKMHK